MSASLIPLTFPVTKEEIRIRLREINAEIRSLNICLKCSNRDVIPNSGWAKKYLMGKLESCPFRIFKNVEQTGYYCAFFKPLTLEEMMILE